MFISSDHEPATLWSEKMGRIKLEVMRGHRITVAAILAYVTG